MKKYTKTKLTLQMMGTKHGVSLFWSMIISGYFWKNISGSNDMPTAHLGKQVDIYLEENRTRFITFETNLAQPSKIYDKTKKCARLLDFLNNNYQLGYQEDFFTKKIAYKEKEIEKLQKLLIDLPLSSKRNDTFRIEIMNFTPLEKLK